MAASVNERRPEGLSDNKILAPVELVRRPHTCEKPGNFSMMSLRVTPQRTGKDQHGDWRDFTTAMQEWVPQGHSGYSHMWQTPYRNVRRSTTDEHQPPQAVPHAQQAHELCPAEYGGHPAQDNQVHRQKEFVADDTRPEARAAPTSSPTLTALPAHSSWASETMSQGAVPLRSLADILGHQPLQVPSGPSPLADSGGEFEWRGVRDHSDRSSPAAGPCVSNARLPSEASEQRQQQQAHAGDSSRLASPAAADRAQSMGGESLGTSQGGQEEDEEEGEGAEGADADMGDQADNGNGQKPMATGSGRRKRYPDIVEEDGTTRPMTAKEFRRLRRRVTNRASAKRMRAKREGELAEVQQQVSEKVSENQVLRDYIGSLEASHNNMARELALWQERWRSTAATNQKLNLQMMAQQQQQRGSPAPAKSHRNAKHPSVGHRQVSDTARESYPAPHTPVYHRAGEGYAPHRRAAGTAGPPIHHLQAPAYEARPMSDAMQLSYNPMRLPEGPQQQQHWMPRVRPAEPYAHELNAALAAIFTARDSQAVALEQD
ncbi:hypothetical protein WJX73_009248 [Symbiochloris irregularis]|uniref:BZIP domain-containing protein n=1 Tax=Symbiochloris irregularis TaxID=706552 RepID=A0AAW1NN86_9CHLO